ncbi:MAG TPA: hypothetical protein GX717_04585 [Clostridiaceae bacterium]|nr:hypothetical protein [Clostridiaceae bacterium]
MNLDKLFKIQAELENRIIEKKGLQGQDLLDKKILALQVELGELANEWRGFKFWSNNQVPRLRDYKQIKCKWCNGSGDDGTGVCPDCKSLGDVYKEYNPLLEEYVDCLHFILSIGLDFGARRLFANEVDFNIGRRTVKRNVLKTFNNVFREIADLANVGYRNYTVLLTEFTTLGDALGFTEEQIEQAYLDKNKINHERQENGY